MTDNPDTPDTPDAPDAPEPTAEPAPPSGRRKLPLIVPTVAGVVAVLVIIAAAMWLTGDSDEGPAARTHDRTSIPKAQPVDVSTLKESSTYSSFDDAPRDKQPQKSTDGKIVHPEADVAIYEAPGGKPFARIGEEQLGDTWLPVITKRPGWVQVMLPSKPNGSTGWLVDEKLDERTTPFEIRVHLESMELELFRDGKESGTWDIGIGKPDTPTPTGRTFLLGSIVDPEQKYSPVILPLGSHSDTLDTFGGGPGTVAIHTWPTDDVIGTATSHGCIRIPADALDRLREVPLGTLVLVDDK